MIAKRNTEKTHRAQTHQTPSRLIIKALPHHYYQQVLKPISRNNIKFNNQKCSLMLKACTSRTKSQEKMIEQPKEKTHGGPKLQVSSFKFLTTNKISNSLHTIRLLEFLQIPGLVHQYISQGPKLQVSSFKWLTINKTSNSLHTIRLLEFLQISGL